MAKHFVNKLGLENFHINLSVTSRNKTQEKILNKMNYVNFKFDGDNYDNKLIEKLKKADYILISIPPKNGKDVVLKNFLNIIENCRAKWITYLSSTSVYGDHKGQWVDELSLLNPTSYNGIDRLYVEKLWMSLYSNKKIPLQIFRLSGIYSNENNVLIKLRSGNAKIIDKKNHFFSRIHVEDIANILFTSISNFKAGEIYNISDDKPAPSEDVTFYGAKILKINKPKLIKLQDVESKMLKNFYKDSKKVSNKKMKIFFRYNLKFPSYIEGLDYIRNNFA